MIKQFIPQEACLKCQGCCRFRELHSIWSPCLLDEEVQELLDKKIPAAYISKERRILPIPNPQGENYICAFFDCAKNQCKIYAYRPFECQLYPFLINLRDKKVILTVDLNCPYVKENLNTPEFKKYTEELVVYLNAPAQIKMLKDNPHILQAYEEVSEIIELKIP